MPEGRVQFVEHRTPECVWQPRWLGHTNGVTALTAVFVAAANPSEAAARYARFTGLIPKRKGRFVTLETSRGSLLIARSSDLDALLGAAPEAPALAGYALACGDPAALARALPRRRREDQARRRTLRRGCCRRPWAAPGCLVRRTMLTWTRVGESGRKVT